MNKKISSASHPITNEVIYSIITKNISDKSIVLDFGAGQGFMSQKVGGYFQSLGQDQNTHLKACEISPEFFKYKGIDCEKISTDSVIPFDDNTFDLIYSIEVLEHTPRPYDFFDQAYAKLKEDGVFIFSVPNILHLKSRFSFLLSGYAEMYGPLSIEDKNAGRICGHIMPLTYNNFDYGLRKSGFSVIDFHIDRRKKSSMILALVLYPILKYVNYKMRKNLKKGDKELFKENIRAMRHINSFDMLSSRSCIIVARKKIVK
jgi:SAM-dependent methyltransferase